MRFQSSELGWCAHVQYRPDMDEYELFLFRRCEGGEIEVVGADKAGLVVTRHAPGAVAPAMLVTSDRTILHAMAEAIREHFGAPQQERVLEQRAAAADASRDYAQGLNDKLLSIIERKLFQAPAVGA